MQKYFAYKKREYIYFTIYIEEKKITQVKEKIIFSGKKCTKEISS
jgi:hypothetical protein